MNGTLYVLYVDVNWGNLKPLAFATTKEEIEKLHDEIKNRGWFCIGNNNYKYELVGFQTLIEECKLVNGMIIRD